MEKTHWYADSCFEKVYSYFIQMFLEHVNLLKRTDPPFLFAMVPPPSVGVPRSEPTPWIGTEVIITGQHALKTCRGTVYNVQKTCSGLRLVIQLTALNPSVPFQRIPFDYDDVVEAE